VEATEGWGLEIKKGEAEYLLWGRHKKLILKNEHPGKREDWNGDDVRHRGRLSTGIHY